MSYRVNNSGRPYDFRRTVNTSVGGELLVGKDWEAIAHTELRRISLMVGVYHQQLKNCAGYEETGQAIEELEKAIEAIAEAAESDSFLQREN